jgi:hypothetical protein
MDNIVRCIKLPYRVKGMTVSDEHGNNNIYINKNLSYEMQIEALKHELEHIKNNDFCSYSPVEVLESRVKYKIKQRKQKGRKSDIIILR